MKTLSKLMPSLKTKKPQRFDDGGIAADNPDAQNVGGGGLLGGLTGALGMQNNYRAHASLNDFQSTSPAQAGTVNAANAQAAGGGGPAAGTIGQMSALSSSLQAAANGQGPNPALDQLRQTTSQNVNQAAGMAASARGVNPAMAARMATDSAAAANQTAAGQAATMTAQQQIEARNALAQNLQATGNMQLGQQQTGVSALGTAGNLSLGSQQLNQLTGAQNAANHMQAQQINAGIAGANAAAGTQLLGSIAQGAGAAFGVAHGGEIPDAGPLFSYLDSVHGPGTVKGFADGGATPQPLIVSAANAPAAPVLPENQARMNPLTVANKATITPAVQSAASRKAGHALADAGKSLSSSGGMNAFNQMMAMPRLMTAYPTTGSIYAHGGKVPAMLSPGEKVLPPGTSPQEAAASVHHAASVPGQAKVSGDSPKNDTVHASLTPGSIVLPRSVVNAKNPQKAASSFVASVLRRHGKYRGGPVHAGAPDPKKGGMVYGAAAAEPEPKKESAPMTARGLGRDEHRRRMSTASAPKHREDD